MLLNSPLSVPISKTSKFILNLNNYRNTHYQSLNSAKKAYLEAMTKQIRSLPKIDYPVVMYYVLYPKTKRLTDIGNVCSVHQKFVEDALINLGTIEDDNYTFIHGSVFTFGGVDKLNPRVTVEIKRSPYDTSKT